MEEYNDFQLLDVSDVQNLLSIGRETTYKLMRNKAFPAVKIGKKYYVSLSHLAKWLDRYQGKEFKI